MGIYSLDFIIILLFLAAASRNGTMIAAWKIAARRRRLHPPYRYAGDPVDVLSTKVQEGTEGRSLERKGFWLQSPDGRRKPQSYGGYDGVQEGQQTRISEV
jgi:hypothetical protein